MSRDVCLHRWLDTHDPDGDAFRCINCGDGRSCECALHFNGWSSVHAHGCPLRLVEAAK